MKTNLTRKIHLKKRPQGGLGHQGLYRGILIRYGGEEKARGCKR